MRKNELIKQLLYIDGNPNIKIGYKYDGIEDIHEDIETTFINYTDGECGVSVPESIIIATSEYEHD